MVTHVDDAIRSIATAMEEASLWENTLFFACRCLQQNNDAFCITNDEFCIIRNDDALLFACSDNGGDTASGASNYPWRGSKVRFLLIFC